MQKTRLSCAVLAALASTQIYAQESDAAAKMETIEVILQWARCSF